MTEDSKDIVQYCMKCGARCAQVKKLSSFDCVTGLPKYRFLLKCAAVKWWTLRKWSHTGHSELTYAEYAPHEEG